MNPSGQPPAKRAAKAASGALMSAELLADSLSGAHARHDTSLDGGADDTAPAAPADATHSKRSDTAADQTDHANDPERKAAHVDADGRERNLKRLRRIEGQVRGLQKMVDDDRYCADIMTQIASVHEALRAVGRELMRNHLKHCATQAIKSGEPRASAMYDELVDMMYKHSR